MSDLVEMEEEDKGTSLASTGNQGGDKKRFEVKKVKFLFSILFIVLIKNKSKLFLSGTLLLYGLGVKFFEWIQTF